MTERVFAVNSTSNFSSRCRKIEFTRRTTRSITDIPWHPIYRIVVSIYGQPLSHFGNRVGLRKMQYTNLVWLVDLWAKRIYVVCLIIPRILEEITRVPGGWTKQIEHYTSFHLIGDMYNNWVYIYWINTSFYALSNCFFIVWNVNLYK